MSWSGVALVNLVNWCFNNLVYFSSIAFRMRFLRVDLAAFNLKNSCWVLLKVHIVATAVYARAATSFSTDALVEMSSVGLGEWCQGQLVLRMVSYRLWLHRVVWLMQGDLILFHETGWKAHFLQGKVEIFWWRYNLVPWSVLTFLASDQGWFWTGSEWDQWLECWKP